MIRKAVKPAVGLSIPGGFWNGLATITLPYFLEPSDIFPTLSFTLPLQGGNQEGFSLNLPPEVYLRQHYPEDFPGCKAAYCRYFTFGIESSSAGTVLGLPVMSAFQVRVDRQNKRIGFGQSQCLMDSLGAYDKVSITAGVPVSEQDCAASGNDNNASEAIIEYSLIGIASVITLAFLVIAAYEGQQCYKKHRK